MVSEGGTGTWLRVFVSNPGVKYQCPLWHHGGCSPDGIVLILLLKRSKKTATVQWPVEFLACIGKIHFTFNGKQPLTRLTFPILRVSFRMNLVPDGKFTLILFNMNLYVTYYFYLHGQFASLLRAWPREICGLHSNSNDFKTESSNCCLILSHFYHPLLPFMSGCRFTRLHSCSPPPSLLSGKPMRTPRRPPSLSRLHWPHADDRRGSAAPWGLIMDNPSCFTIHKLRLLRFKHVFIPIPCSFLSLLLSSFFFF